MKIDIVMTYHNRLEQLRGTLNSIRAQAYKELKIILVDDGSDSKQAASLLLNEFQDLAIHNIYIDPKDKTWINPSIPYNRGFEEVTGDVVLIQNPECVHIGQVLKTVQNRVAENTYLTFPCYSLNQGDTETFLKLNHYNKPFQVGDWYNHPQHNQSNLHFCSAIMATDLKKVGGFDERLKNGYCFDDNLLLHNIKKLGISVICLHPSNGAMVYHLWHTKQRLGCCPEWHHNHELYLKIIHGEM